MKVSIKKSISLLLAVIMIIATVPMMNASAETSGKLTYEVENGEVTITECDKSASGKLTIPSKLNGYPVTYIGDGAFYGCTGLKSITIPDSVTDIYGAAFYGCTGLTNITIPDSVISIGNKAFYNTGYYKDSSNWENKVLYIGNYLVNAKTSITGSYEIKSGTKCIAEGAFYGCENLTSITIPDSVTSIGGFAFKGCTGLESITIPNSVTSIGDSTFIDCASLTSIIIPDSVTTIDWYAFYGCTALKSITIFDSVTSIGEMAFYDTAYYNKSSNWKDGVLYIGNHLIKAKNSIKGSYKIKSGTKCIADVAFKNRADLTSITIPDSVTSIGFSAFYGCTGLTSIKIPDSVTSIGSKAFDNTAYYKDSSNWENGALYIGNHLISLKESVKDSYEIKLGTKCVAEMAFKNRTHLKSITIPDSVTNISSHAFFYCTDLTDVYFLGTEEAWGEVKIGDNNIPLSAATIHYNCSYSENCNHNYTLTNTKEATCTSKGKKTLVCSSCGTKLYEDIEALGHAYGEWVITKEITCTKSGAMERTCSNCGKVQTKTVDATGHNYSDWTTTKKATCTKSGTKERTCLDCGKVQTKTINALGHNYSSKWTVDKKATCTKAGSKSHHCKRCSSKSDVTTIKATGHSYGNWKTTKKATCTKAGSKQRTCSTCGNVQTKTISKLGHNYSSKWTVDKKATCTKAGSKSHHCTRCSAKKDVTTIKAKGHSYKTTTTTKATTSKNGTRTTKCTVCGNVKSTTKIAKISSVTLSSTKYTYNGKVKKPTVTVKDSNGKKLTKDTDYTVKYSSGRKNVGKYTVTVTFKGKYSGSKKLTFKINPKGTSISKLTAGTKKFTVKINKQSTQTTGYQIQYSTSSKMSNAKTKTYANTKTTSRTISGLKSAKKYYVRVRTYKTVDGSKYYSSWSSIKNVKTK